MRFLLATALLFATITPALADDDHVLTVDGDDGQARVLTCEAGDRVAISGDEHRIFISGPCRSLELTGNNVRVDIESVASITITGSHNSIGWHKGPAPRVEQSGEGNRVARAGRSKQPAP
jgi:hypothetical protein